MKHQTLRSKRVAVAHGENEVAMMVLVVAKVVAAAVAATKEIKLHEVKLSKFAFMFHISAINPVHY